MSLEKKTAVEPGRKEFHLTPQDEQLIAFVVAGYTDKEIAVKLGASEQTIKHQIAGIFGKLDVSDRLELVLFALHHHLIDFDPTTFQSNPTTSEAEHPYVHDAESVMTGTINKGFPGL
jgi:DNA-binding CsgD family transcriptional regulator